MANDTSKACYFNNNPCIWLKLIGTLALTLSIGCIPFTYSNLVQIEKNTVKIEKMEDIQAELKTNSENIIRITVILEGMQKSLVRLETQHQK